MDEQISTSESFEAELEQELQLFLKQQELLRKGPPPSKGLKGFLKRILRKTPITYYPCLWTRSVYRFVFRKNPPPPPGHESKLRKFLKKHPFLYRISSFFWRQYLRLFRKAIPQPVYTKKDLKEQRATSFEAQHTFSILVPLYNTPIRFLRAMIRSVQAQTYPNWELCLADGSDDRHKKVGRRVRRFQKHDTRIRYVKLEKNLGISGNTNACIDLASGDYIALFDHDDLLHPAALYEMMQEITRTGADFVYTDEAVFKSPRRRDIVMIHYKPDFAPDTLRGANYICHFSAFSRELMDKIGRFRPEFDGSQDHDLILRLTEQAKHVAHIPKVLYFWRSHAKSTAGNVYTKSYAVTAGQRAVQAAIERAGQKAVVQSNIPECPTLYRIRYEITVDGLVSILIPTKNHCADLRKCIDSIRTLTTYKHYEILIIDNGSDEQELLDYYKELESIENIRVIFYDIPFNYSKINNYAVQQAKGEYYILLNNDIEIITPEWIEEMLMYVQRPDVGIAGATLYYPDDTIQHAGVIVGLGGVAGHACKHFRRGEYGYIGRLLYAQNLSAVTAACLMVKASVFHEVGGLDETFCVAFNDVDFCLRVRGAGYLIVQTPFAQAYHYESKSRGYEDTPEKIRRFQGEFLRFRKRWKTFLDAGDPYYNPHLTIVKEDFSYR